MKEELIGLRGHGCKYKAKNIRILVPFKSHSETAQNYCFALEMCIGLNMAHKRRIWLCV